jgi:hypothetical protein
VRGRRPRRAPTSHSPRAQAWRRSAPDDLSAVDELSFREEAVRERRENRLLIRSRYRQPFGTFAGTLPGGVTLAEGYGVMEDHDVHW